MNTRGRALDARVEGPDRPLAKVKRWNVEGGAILTRLVVLVGVPVVCLVAVVGNMSGIGPAYQASRDAARRVPRPSNGGQEGDRYNRALPPGPKCAAAHEGRTT